MQANCGHIYCAGCINRLWVNKNYAQLDCPICRRQITIFFEYFFILIKPHRNYQPGEQIENDVKQNIKKYNRMYSGQSRPVFYLYFI